MVTARMRRAIAVCLVCLGVAPYIYARHRYHSHNWTPLATAIILKPGQFQSPEFTTDLNARYLILLAFDQSKGIDPHRAQCAMGISVLNCTRDQRTVRFDWELISENGNVIQRGAYEPLGFSGAGEVDFATFQGKRGATQRVVLRIQQDAGELNAADPKLLVQAGPENWEAIADLQSYSMLWAIIIVPLSLLWLAVPVLRRKSS